MGRLNRLTAIIGVIAVLMLAVAAVTYTSRGSQAGNNPTAPNCNEGDAVQADGETAAEEVCGAAGQIDDGAERLSEAGISLDAAIAAARTAATGDIGEIDLEDYNGALAFNVDVGDQDVKVDAQTGEVVGVGSD